jgi:hypothetical protein
MVKLRELAENLLAFHITSLDIAFQWCVPISDRPDRLLPSFQHGGEDLVCRTPTVEIVLNFCEQFKRNSDKAWMR